MLAGPPAFRRYVENGGPFFCARIEEVTMTFKYKLSVRLALLKDVLLAFCARKEVA
jgi:hypothetical protein